MRIRMKQTISGTRNGEEWPARGEIADIPTGEAQHLVASGIAEEVAAGGPEDDSENQDPDGTPEDQRNTEPNPLVPPVETATAPATAEKRPASTGKAPAAKPAKE
ncbi:hypothetical protein ACIRD6_13325 [Streptomyces sp. NPDC102473]|uniref:hypothetical protein n=1 Tax=Streptomyces sp. NPDC102473 TaxID=3366180 RepID=UPI0037F46D47